MRTTLRGMFWFASVGLALFSLVVVALATANGFERAAPHLAHYLSSHALPLYGHVIFGPLALCLLPFQFWTGLRTRNVKLHRATGYAYVASVVMAGICSLLMLPRFSGSAWAATGFVLLALLWLATTLAAVIHARAGRIKSHRVWVLRSAALTFAAVVLRLLTLPLMSTGLTLAQSYDVTAWASWLVPLIAVEWQRRRRRAPVLTPANA